MKDDAVSNFDDDAPERAATDERARELVLAYGFNSTSYQILNPGIEHWFSAKNAAVVGFVACAGVRVVAGAPICANENLVATVAEFEADARRKGMRVCYFCAEERLAKVFADSLTHTKFLLGAQPIWEPRAWAAIADHNKSLRAQLNRARNKNVKIVEWTGEKAVNNETLRECLRLWLADKGLPPLRFLVEPHTLSQMFSRRIFVAECDGAIVGFVLLSPITQRRGWLFEQFVYRPGAPNGTVKLLIDTAMRAIAADGSEFATLGLSPLSVNAPIQAAHDPWWLRLLLGWMRKHGRRFYNFDGLDSFKAKLQPQSWEPVFAIADEAHLSPRTLYAITSAFSGNHPFRLLSGGLSRALLTEIKWLHGKFARSEKSESG